MSLEITSEPPTQMEGDLKSGDVIARHLVRAVDAIVLLEPVVKQNGDTIPAGVALAQVSFAAIGAHPTIWCDVRPNHRLLFANQHDCFEDTLSSGHLDKVWASNSQDSFAGLPVSGVGTRIDLLPHSAAYRPARPEERPTAILGLKFCDGDNVSSPARFALALAIVDGAEFKPTAGDCRFGVWANPADKTTVSVDQLTLTLTPSNAPGVFHFKVAGRLEPRALGWFAFDSPLEGRDDSATPTAPAPPKPIFTALDQPQIVLGQAGLKQAFVTQRVKYATTGVLQNEVHPTGGLLWPQESTLGYGQPVFGVSGAARGGDGIAWCATKKIQTEYRTDCLFPTGAGYVYESARKPYLAPSVKSLLGDTPVGPVNSDPTVTQDPTALPTMSESLSLVSVAPLSETDKSLVYHIGIDLDCGYGPQTMHEEAYVLPPEGEIVHLLGVTLLLKPGSQPDTLQVQSAPPAAVQARSPG